MIAGTKGQFAMVLASALCTMFCTVVSVRADEPAAALSIATETFELDNGLRVVLAEDHLAPIVTVAVIYDVGSRNEIAGRTGFAHLFEHMMFEGSANIGKGEHFGHINANGGRMNGFTQQDLTAYFEVLPADRLELGFWLESDRMMSLNIGTENFENQREVVKEERRLRVDNEPYVPAWLAFLELAYESFEYSHSVIGSMDDLDAAELADVQAFFELYYRPNNAILVVTGDFEPVETRALVERYFGEIPRGETPPPVAFVEPPQTEQRVQVYDDPIATQPMLMMGWHVPPEPHADNDALRVLAHILGGGESSRLYTRLVREEGVALDASASLWGRRGPDLFIVEATSQGVAPERLQNLVREEIERLRASGITTDELAAARQQLIRRTVQSGESNLYRAIIIGIDMLFFDDPTRINSEIDRINSVSASDVQRVIDAYLLDTNSSIMFVNARGQEVAE